MSSLLENNESVSYESLDTKEPKETEVIIDAINDLTSKFSKN